MVKIPLARHPANHILVQQLLLLGTLHEAHCPAAHLHLTLSREYKTWANECLSTKKKGTNFNYNIFFCAAFELAQSDISYWESVTLQRFYHEEHQRMEQHSISLFRFHPLIHYILMQRIDAQSRLWQTLQNISHYQSNLSQNVLKSNDQVELCAERKHLQENDKINHHHRTPTSHPQKDNNVDKNDSNNKHLREEEENVTCFVNTSKHVNAQFLTKWQHSVVLPPQKAIALYGPHTLLPSLPSTLHDKASYCAALAHCEKLTRLLSPYGFQVGLVGSLRCGAPYASEVEICISLTSSSTAECLSMMHDDGLATNELLHKEKEEEEKWTRAFYGAVESITERNSQISSSELLSSKLEQEEKQQEKGRNNEHHEDFTESSSSEASLLLSSMLQKEHCPISCANALHDSIPAQVLHRYRRAVDMLIRSGYVVAGNYPFSHSVFSVRPFRSILRNEALVQFSGGHGFGDDGKVFSVRYDPHEPTSLLPFHITNVEQLRRMQLHRLVLYFTPWKCFHTRRFFLTGPAVFTRHVILESLRRGIEINKNGVFVSKAKQYKEHNVRKNVSSCIDTKPQMVGAEKNEQQQNLESNNNKESTSIVNNFVERTQPILRRAFEFAPMTDTKGNADNTFLSSATYTNDDSNNNNNVNKNNSNDEDMINVFARESRVTPEETMKRKTELLPTLSPSYLYRTRLLIESEKDIFTLAGVPYTDPLNRAIYCQVHNLFPANVVTDT